MEGGLTYRILYVKISMEGVERMLALNYTQFRNEMKTHLDRVTDDYETVVVTRKENKNVVIISEDAYNNMLENMHLLGNKANYDWLMESKAQLETGSASVHPLTEVSDE